MWNRKRTGWFTGCVLAVLLVAAGAPTMSSAATGEFAPEFELSDFAGKAHKSSEYRGKPMLVNFWASWCGPCRQEMPELAKLNGHYGQQVQFVGINLSVNDDLNVAKALLKHSEVHYQTLLDQTGDVANRYRVQAIPTTLVLGADGKVIGTVVGPNLSRIEQLLRQASK